MDTRPLEIVIAFDGDAAGQAAVAHLADEIAREGRRRWRPAAEWEIDGEIEFWRALHEAAIDSEAAAWTGLAVADLERTREQRRRLPFKRQPAPFNLREIVQRVKERADILAIFGARAPHCTQSARPMGGQRVVMLCPLHPERTGSLVIYRDQQSWWCFGCKQGGDAITAVMLLDDLDFVPALRDLAEEFGIDWPKPPVANLRRIPA